MEKEQNNSGAQTASLSKVYQIHMATLQDIVAAVDRIIPDDSLLPTPNGVHRLSPQDLNNISETYAVMASIIRSDKISLNPIIARAIKDRVKNYQSSLATLKNTQQVSEACASFLEFFREKKQYPLFNRYKEIENEFLAALKAVDVELDLFKENPDDRDKTIQNLAYASASSVTAPEKKHVLLARSMNYIQPFDALFGIAYSSEFGRGGFAEENRVAKHLHYPDLQITHCDLESLSQPYLISRETKGRTSLPDQWFDASVPKRDNIRNILQQHLGRITTILSSIAREPNPPPKTEEKTTVPTIGVRRSYTMRPIKEKNTLSPKLTPPSICPVVAPAALPAVQATVHHQEQSHVHEKQLLTLYESIRIIDQKDNPDMQRVSIRDLEANNLLEKRLTAYGTLRELAENACVKKLLETIKKDLVTVKTYLENKYGAFVKSCSDQLDRLGASAKSIEEQTNVVNQQITAADAEKTKYFKLIDDKRALEQRIESVPAQMLAAQTIVSPYTQSIKEQTIVAEPRASIYEIPKILEGKGRTIYENLRYILGREPKEGEELSKGSYIKAAGVTGAGFKLIVNRAKISQEIIPRKKRTDKTIVFDLETLNKIGKVMHKEILQLSDQKK